MVAACSAALAIGTVGRPRSRAGEIDDCCRDENENHNGEQDGIEIGDEMTVIADKKLTPEEIDSILGTLRKAMEEGTTFYTADACCDRVELETGFSTFRTFKPGQWHQQWTFKIDGPVVMR